MTNPSTRLFQNSFWERLTHVHHNTPLFIYGPVIFACLFFPFFSEQMRWISLIGTFIFGIFQWTFFEYVMHRYLFHYEPTSNWGKKLVYLFHGIHHDHPNEADRLVMPPVTSIPIAATVCGFYYVLFGTVGLVMYAGFTAGYLYYEFVHYSVHHKRKKPLGWTDSQRKNHLCHHFQDSENRFGVTSPLWDFIFRTYC